jgi:hypothetical protein
MSWVQRVAAIALDRESMVAVLMFHSPSFFTKRSSPTASASRLGSRQGRHREYYFTTDRPIANLFRSGYRFCRRRRYLSIRSSLRGDEQ